MNQDLKDAASNFQSAMAAFLSQVEATKDRYARLNPKSPKIATISLLEAVVKGAGKQIEVAVEFIAEESRE